MEFDDIITIIDPFQNFDFLFYLFPCVFAGDGFFVNNFEGHMRTRQQLLCQINSPKTAFSNLILNFVKIDLSFKIVELSKVNGFPVTEGFGNLFLQKRQILVFFEPLLKSLVVFVALFLAEVNVCTLVVGV